MHKFYNMMVLTLLLCSLLIVSCGGTDDNQDEPTPTATATVQPESTPTLTPVATNTEIPVSQLIIELLSKSADIECLNYDMVVGDDEVTTTRVWEKGLMQRVETFEGESIDESNLKNITIIDGNSLAMYYIEGSNAIQLPIDPETAETALDPTANILDHNPVITGTGTYRSMLCTIVEYKTPVSEVTMWLWNEYGLPVNVIVTSGDSIATWERRNISFDCAPDSMFELPEGILNDPPS